MEVLTERFFKWVFVVNMIGIGRRVYRNGKDGVVKRNYRQGILRMMAKKIRERFYV